MKTPQLTLILVTIAILSTVTGLTPLASATIFKSHEPIHISGNGNFTQINGVTGGSGKPSDPYTIEGWEINTADRNGIEIYNSSVHFIIRNLNIKSNFLGILLQNVSNGTLEGLTISDSETAIQLSNCDGLIISGNKLLKSQNGIFITLGSTNISVSGNTILSNTSYGMYLFLTTQVTVYHNNFVNNTFQARDSGTNDSWNASYPLGGNYWSDYTGVDNCSGPKQNICPNPDGIGDTPYVIKGGGVVDNYPLIKPSDSGPPSWPEGSSLTATVVRSTSITLAWSAATDDTVVVSYRLLLGNNVVAVVPSTFTSYNITGLQPNKTFTFHLQAEDLARIWSSNGPSTTVKTPAIQPNNVQNVPNLSLVIELGLAFLVAAVIAVSSVYLVIRSRAKVKERRFPRAWSSQSLETKKKNGRRLLWSGSAGLVSWLVLSVVLAVLCRGVSL